MIKNPSLAKTTNTMFQQLIYVLSLIIAVTASGEFIVIGCPKGISFKGDEEINLSVLKDVYSASLGFSVEESSSWTGVYLNDPFNLADAIVNVVVDGVNTLEPRFNQHFPLHANNELEENTFDALEKRILDRYPDEKNIMTRVLLNQGVNALKDVKIFSELRVEKVNSDYLYDVDDVTKGFLEELRLLSAITSKVGTLKMGMSNSRDVYWFVLSGLKEIADWHGENSTEASTAKNKLFDALNEMNSAFQMAYNNRALVTVITNSDIHARIARSLKADDEMKDINLAVNYDPVYPVIFNIILWFSVIMFFSILAISIAIGGMDPGRDSIIYRMTSNRMKKDN